MTFKTATAAWIKGEITPAQQEKMNIRAFNRAAPLRRALKEVEAETGGAVKVLREEFTPLGVVFTTNVPGSYPYKHLTLYAFQDSIRNDFSGKDFANLSTPLTGTSRFAAGKAAKFVKKQAQKQGLI